MQRTRFAILLTLITGIVLGSACSSGGGGSGPAGEPVVHEQPGNSTTSGATPLPLGRWGVGDLVTSSATDYWRVPLEAGDVVRIEMHALRADHARWAANGSPPFVELLDPSFQCTTYHDPGAWPESRRRDLDIPLHRVDRTGDYFVLVWPRGPQAGEYSVRVTKVELPGLFEESEARGVAGGNDSVAIADGIESGEAVHGYLHPGDLDFFRFRLDEKSRIAAEVTMGRIGISPGETAYAKPRLHLYRADGSLVTYMYSAISVDLNADWVFDAGDYAIALDELESDGSDVSAEYFLEFEAFSLADNADVEPDDSPSQATPVTGDFLRGVVATGEVDFYSFQAAAGDVVEFELFRASVFATLDYAVLDPSLNALQRSTGNTWRVLVVETGTHFVRLTGDTEYWIRRRSTQPATMETEPNQDATQADRLRRASGMPDAPFDVDAFAFQATKDVLVALDLYSLQGGAEPGNGVGSLYLPGMRVLDPSGAQVLQTGDLGNEQARGLAEPGPSATLSFVPSTSGTYTVELEPRNPSYGSLYKYVLEVR